MTEVMIAFGTRPSFIKLAPVYRALVQVGITPFVVCTGQHDELIRQHMGQIDMPVHRWLDVMRESTSLNDTLRLVIECIDEVLQEFPPRLLLVHGDTTSGLGAALAGFHRSIPVAHVEAGLRSGNVFSPYPEELNRVGMDALSTFLFAPTIRALSQAEKVNNIAHAVVTGNPVIDAVYAMRHALPLETTRSEPYLLLELHRRESFGTCMLEMVQAVLNAAHAHGHRVLWPVHPNPAVQIVAERVDDPILEKIAPLSYVAFLDALQHASLILTDSGGTVEECTALKRPSLQLREYTDRQEAVAAGFSWLTGRDPSHIEKLMGEALAMHQRWAQSLADKPSPYGDGTAGQKIAGILKEWLF